MTILQRGSRATSLARPAKRRYLTVILLVGLGGVGWSVRAQAEEPAAASASSPKKGGGGSSSASKRAAPKASSGDEQAGASSGATETIALEIVAKAPKPIPPVELDMLQLRLMLTDLKASFMDEIDQALFQAPF